MECIGGRGHKQLFLIFKSIYDVFNKSIIFHHFMLILHTKMSTTASPAPILQNNGHSPPPHSQQLNNNPTSPTQMAIFMCGNGGGLLNQKFDEPEDNLIIHPHREQMHRRDAIVPEEQPSESDRENGGDFGADCNLIIVPHLQVTADNESPHLYNRAISAGGGLLADLQRATLATHHFYAENNGNECQSKARSPWILRRLYEWSNRAKSREMLKHVHAALDSTTNGTCSATEGGGDEDEHYEKLLNVQWEEMFSPLNGQTKDLMLERDKRRLKAVWELFHSELVFLIRQLLVLRNVYKEPLKKCQVEGCLLGVEPELLFGNLDQLIRISRRFCQSFLSLLEEVKCAGAPFRTTEMIVQLFKRFAKGPSTISAYQAYCINYKATIEYLGTVRQKEERFVDFERVCMNDPRCVRLQLEDLLISPLQRITRLPILLREILRHTEPQEERQCLEKVLEQMNESLRSIDDSVQWLHNFERLQQLQHQIVWPPVNELEPKTYIPDFLKGALSRQFCENLLAHPRRKLVHEGHLEYIENGRTSDCYCFLFNDMFLITKMKKVTLKSKKNASNLSKQEFYIVHRQPIPLDSCVFCDAESDLETQQNVSLKNAFVVIHLTRYYQVLNIYTMQTVNKREKEIWIEKFQESIENYESIQLKDMLRSTPLFSSLSLRRSSSARSHNSSSGIGSPVNGIENGVNGGQSTPQAIPIPTSNCIQNGQLNATNRHSLK